MNSEKDKIYILPGMGADSAMYGPEFGRIENTTFVNWPEYKNEKSIPDLAHRIIEEYSIKEGDIAAGSSLGGIISAEISKHIRLKKIFLIGSTLVSGRFNSKFDRLSKLPGSPPVKSVQFISGLMSKVLKGNYKHLIDMFCRTDPRFIKAMIKALPKWDGCPNPSCEVISIHGAKDKIILPGNESLIVNDAGHMIAMTHGEEVVGFIMSNL